MLKKNWKFLFCLLTIIVISAGCNKNNESESSKNTSKEVGITQNEGVVLDEEVLEKSKILEKKSDFTSDGILSYIPNEVIESGVQQQVALFNNNLLLYGSSYTEDKGSVLNISMISLKDGSSLYNCEIPELETYGIQKFDKQIVVCNWSNGDIYILDETLKIQKEYQVSASDGAIYVSSDIKTAYVFSNDSGISVVDIESGEVKDVLLKNSTYLFASTVCGNNVSLGYTDKQTQLDEQAVLDLNAGTVLNVPFEENVSNVGQSGSIWVASDFEKYNVCYIGESGRPLTYKITLDEGSITLIDSPTRMILTNGDDAGNTLKLYETDGRFLSGCTMSTEYSGLMNMPVWSEADGGYFFTTIDSSGKDILLFWDLSIPCKGMDLTLEVHQDDSEAGSIVSQDLYNKASSLSKAYSVDIKIAEKADTTYTDFKVKQTMNEDYITAGLEALENVFKSYPEGFVQQLTYGSQKKIEINLVGTLTKTTITEKEVSGFTSFAGFVDEQSGKNVMAVDITLLGSVEQIMYHEMTHLIDKKLEFDALIREDAVYSEEGWMALNPKGFVYAETYDEIPMSYFEEGNEEYFVDYYSKTFVVEDRARIMEYAMVSDDWVFSSSPQRIAKLEYFSKCIRDAFDTTGWPDKTVWEKMVERCK